MDNELQIFNYGDKDIRIVVVDGNPQWVAKDVCDVLDLGNTSLAVNGRPDRPGSGLDEDEKGVANVNTLGGLQEMIVVNESGLYSLIMTSRKPEAKVFKRWTTHEVLPSIRKHGAYATDATIDKILNDPEFGIQLLTTLKEEREKRIKAEKTNAILMHVNKTYTATEIAKELGFSSAIALNRFLHDKHIQFKQNQTWVLYSDYADCGYEEIKQEVLDNGKIIYHRRWTQLGRDFLLQRFSSIYTG